MEGETKRNLKRQLTRESFNVENKENFNSENFALNNRKAQIKSKPAIKNTRNNEAQAEKRIQTKRETEKNEENPQKKNINKLNSNMKKKALNDELNYDIALENNQKTSNENPQNLLIKINLNPNEKNDENSDKENLKNQQTNTEANENNKPLLSERQKRQFFFNKYLEKENVIIIRNYGTQIYNYMCRLETNGIQPNFMDKHKINPDVRTKMVDWMIEVLSVYRSENETFFLSVTIMDMFIQKSTKILTTDEIHLLGLTSMFIASKFEDVFPIRMSSLVGNVGHNLFTIQEIISKEKKILEVVNFDSLIISSTYEFIRTFFYDFNFNNRSFINQLTMQKEVQELERRSINFSKLMCYSHVFYGYGFSIKALACIIAAFDTLRTYEGFANSNSEKFFREWILFLMEESNHSSENINEVYQKVIKYYSEYESIPLISYNLKKI